MAPRTWATAAGILLVAVILLVLTGNSLEANDSLGSIAAALVAIGTAFTGIVLYVFREQRPEAAEQEADALATELLAQWDPEIRRRRQRFDGQRLIPLGWAGTSTGPVRVRSGGKLEGNPDTAAIRIADAFDQIPSKRLVVIGEPGSGKTFLGVLLTLGLLRRREAGAPVPVFLSLSSWDPVEDTLDDWLVHTLAKTHYNGRPRTAKTLLLHRLVLPILDGLDELPDHVRRRAVSRLNEVLDGDRPLVLTCRVAEYEDLIAGGAPTLLGSPVVRINPVSTADTVIQLKDWPAIADHVERDPAGPLATALSTPLMLSLFVASHRERSPDELLDSTKFTNRHAVEDHLVDLMVRTVYPDPKRRRWLGFLAETLHRDSDHDFRWWQLARLTLSPWIAPLLGFLVAATVYAFLTATVSSSFEEQWRDPASDLVRQPELVATLFGLVVTWLWLVSAGREPGPVAASSGLHSFGKGVLTGTSLMLVPGVLILLLGTGVLNTDVQQTYFVFSYVGALLAVSVVSGLGVGLHELVAARTSRVSRVSPEELVAKDRWSAFASASVAGTIVGTLAIPAGTVGAIAGGHLGQRFESSQDSAVVVNLGLPQLQTYVPWSLAKDNAPALLANSVLIALLFAMAVLVTRAWTRFLVARAALALSGRLPWRLMRFLADARDRGLLRGSGGSYQFWHVRLQERLIMTADRGDVRRRVPKLAIAGLTSVFLIASAAVIWSAEPQDCRTTGWSEVDSGLARVKYRDATGCFALVAEDDWQILRKQQSDEPLLAKIAADRPPSSDARFARVTIVGELRNTDPLRWQEILRGLSTAQDVRDEPLVVGFAHSDVGHESSSDFHTLARDYVVHHGDRRAYGAAINIDGTRSTVYFGQPGHSSSVIGLRDPDLLTISRQFAQNMINYFVPPGREVTSTELTDGVSQNDCARLQDLAQIQASGMTANVDLRGVEPSIDLLEKLAACSSLRVIVDQRYAANIRAHQDQLPQIDVVYVDDRSATLTEDCRTRLITDTEIATCVAALTAADSARVRLMQATTSI